MLTQSLNNKLQNDGNFTHARALRVKRAFNPRRYSTWSFPVRKTLYVWVNQIRSSYRLFRTHQLSGRRICFAELTRHGSAYVGEFIILRENSLFAAMTIKLWTMSTQTINSNDMNRHIEDTCCGQLASPPLFLVTLNGGVH